MTPNADFNLQVIQELPPNRRLPRFIAAAKGFVSALVYDYGIFYAYINGSDAYVYDSGVTYGVGSRVVYNFQVFESLVSSNTGNIPDVSTASWRKILDYFIGASERTKYNASKIVFEYALNRFFRTTFAQPPATSDIFITNTVPAYPSFLVGYTESASSYIGDSSSSGFVTSTEVFTTASSYQFVIHFPLSLYTALGANAEKIIRSIADKYAISGTLYTIITY